MGNAAAIMQNPAHFNILPASEPHTASPAVTVGELILLLPRKSWDQVLWIPAFPSPKFLKVQGLPLI